MTEDREHGGPALGAEGFPTTGAAALAHQFRNHFGHRDHLYGQLLADLADDLEAGGIVATICRDRLDAPRSEAVSLRLLAGVFRVVLRGDAPALTRFYPNLGGTADPGDCWPALHPVLVAHADELHDALDLPLQTNEVGRSACLAAGLFEAVRRHGLARVRLLEPGASAGLNLRVDHYRIVGPGWSWGDPASPLTIDTLAEGVQPTRVDVVQRRGCDLAPIDASTPEGARWLTSFVWPFDLARHARLAAALQVAAAYPVDVDEESAAQWLERQLAEPADPGVLTVVWESITRQYWPADESARVDALVAAARARMPLAHVTMEGVPPAQVSGGFDIATHGPELRVDGEVIARSHHHGPPVLLVR